MQQDIKTVFITGASSGIGRQTAFKFAHAGSRLIITYHQHKREGEETKDKCLDMGALEVMVLPLNLRDNQSIKDAIQKIVERYSQIDILINNAGFLIHNFLEDQSFDEITSQIKTNLEGLIKITKLSLPYVKQAIINVGSNLGRQGKGKLTVYSATKFGVRGFTKSLAKEMPKLRIYTVNPSLTATKMGSPQGLEPEKVAEIIFKAALGKYKVKSGEDINVRDYLYGEFWKNFIILRRFIKHCLKR